MAGTTRRPRRERVPHDPPDCLIRPETPSFANIVLVLVAVGGRAGPDAGRCAKRSRRSRWDSVVVRVIWPGADPEEVEEGITRKIEEAVADLDGIKQYTTYSSEGISSTLIEVYRLYDVDDVMQGRAQCGRPGRHAPA